MPGFSLTLLLLPPSPSPTVPTTVDLPPEEVLLSLLDVSTDTPGWKWTSQAPPSKLRPPPAALTSERSTDHALKVRAEDAEGFTHAVERACKALDRAEPEITRMDTISGDGDCGLTLRTGARGMRSHEYHLNSLLLTVLLAVLACLRAGSISGEDVIGALTVVSEVAAEKMGGTSGALYSCVRLMLAFTVIVLIQDN